MKMKYSMFLLAFMLITNACKSTKDQTEKGATELSTKEVVTKNEAPKTDKQQELKQNSNSVAQQGNGIQWLSWAEAQQLAQTDKNPKKLFIDVYTDWCGWCKRMDKDTFQNPEVATYMQQHFYMVKFDGEGSEEITYKDKNFNFVPSGRRGYHEFAAFLLRGRLSYPTTIFMDENMELLSPVPGYHKPQPFLQIARFFGDNIYLEKDWQEYSGSGK